MNNLISVIVPIYGVEKYLAQCVDSLLAQSYDKLEIILVDDGSPDKCGEICDEYEKKDKRVKVIHKQNGGLSSARNAGLKCATGQYIGYVDSDDYVDPMMYDKMLALIKGEDADIVECSCVTFSDGEKPSLTHDERTERWSGEEALKRLMDYGQYSLKPRLAVWTKLFRREIVEDLQFPDGKIHEDVVYDCRAFLRSKTYIMTKDQLCYHRVRKGSIMQMKFGLKDFSKIELMHERTTYLFDNGYAELGKVSQINELVWLLEYFCKSSIHGLNEQKHQLKSVLMEESKKKILKTAKLPNSNKRLINLFYFSPELAVSFYKTKEMIKAKC